MADIPAEVWVEVFPASILSVSEVESSFTYQFHLAYSYADPSGQDCEEQTASLDGIFDPSFEFANATNVGRVSPYFLSIDGKEVYVEAKYSGTFKGNFDFRLFPFDTQTFRVKLLPFHASDEVVFRQAEVDPSILDNLAVSGWLKQGFGQAIAQEVWQDETYQALTYDITLSRQSISHFVRLFVPLLVIAILNLVSLLMPMERFDNKISVQLSALISIAAYSVVLGRKLPDLPYLIVADAAILASFLLSAFVLAFTMLGSRKPRG